MKHFGIRTLVSFIIISRLARFLHEALQVRELAILPEFQFLPSFFDDAEHAELFIGVGGGVIPDWTENGFQRGL